jgi:predicted RNase H-like nuclease (RuvC/YqgF family)
MKTRTQQAELEVSRLKYENDNIKNILNEITKEYADYKIECDEICKEYEETIQLLTDSVDKYKLEITKLNKEKEKMKIDQEKLTKELEKAREKNRDKIKDIEILNNKLDQLQSLFKSINKKETTLKSKVVTLETDNDHYLSKIHQFEEEVSDLKTTLESTIESLITTQNDFEEFKNKKEEEIERLKLKLQEEKSNVTALMTKKNDRSRHSRMKSCINGPIKEENEDLGLDEEVGGKKRKLSWNDNDHLEKNQKTIDSDEEEIDEAHKKDLDKEQERWLEFGGGRLNRARTIQKNTVNFGQVVSKLRKRKEELVQLNKKIKKDAAKIGFI